MKKIHRALAGILAAAVLVPSLSATARAAAPSVSTDEAVYVNLDYYGKPQKVNIVKGCDLNGADRFTDYGSYEKVTNMTNEVQPAVSGDSVSWKLPQSTGRFYYECTPKNGTVALPWNFDVSYKLNGVPTAADKLAGASGLVEIDIKTTPDKSAPEYYRNNLLLQVGTVVKMKDTLSVEAPGAQVQSLGDYKAILFAGLPGEETTDVIRIGTNSFESIGIVMMMVPGTLEQMQDIKDLKEDKDTIKGSLDAVNDSVNEILGTLESMSGGLKQTQSGLAALDGARRTVSSSKGGVYSSADKALADLSQTASQTSALVPHLQKSQQLVEDVSTTLNTMSQNVTVVGSTMASLSATISKVRSDVNDLRDVLDDADDASGKRAALAKDLNTQLGTAKTTAKQLAALLSQMDDGSAQLAADVQSLMATMHQIQNPDTSTQQLLQSISTVLTSLQTVQKSSATLETALKAVLGQSDSFFDTGTETVSVLDSYLDVLDEGTDSADDLLRHANQAGGNLKDLLNISQSVTDNIAALNGTMNQYKDDTVGALKDMENLVSSLARSLTSAQAFLTSLETVAKTSGDKLDDGTRQTLNGLISVLQKALSQIDDTSTVKNANHTIQSAVDKELDKFEDENNFLNLDAKAKPISFTSLKNASPSSIQIVLRTQEISKDEGNQGEKDLEQQENGSSILDRIRNVFTKLWSAITSVFS
ncbi:hypothetical protein [Caproiciproducens sp. CPB-2]|uniref:hypothetical protein n=1 Tax=Caproiciproducens sp. CPB-2 TaxID=3030017 RepID=UPI0023DB5EFF|nr:hypothetical protein [Caproiciproducens sp. CPB-2]MDF1496397.1 hypothetical protein [Caproiciproducens sp. CPB-2]